jgi:hypothetical protein
MTIPEFLEHWSLAENPFQGEEARNDAVFRRMLRPSGSTATLKDIARADAAAAQPLIGPYATAFHSDFAKVMGDPERPASAILFGEKGSGKTAMRLQIAQRLARFNIEHPDRKVLLIPYDDLNAFLDKFHERTHGKTPLDSFHKFRVVDHLDAILLLIVPRLVDTLLGLTGADDPLDLGQEPRKILRKLPVALRRDVLLLQVVYDRAEQSTERTQLLRARMGLWRPIWSIIGDFLMGFGPILIVAYVIWALLIAPDDIKTSDAVRYGFFALCGSYLLALGKFFAFDRLASLNTGRRLRKQIRVGARTDASFSRSLRQLDHGSRDLHNLPTSDSDEPRYAALQRLRRVLKPFGYTGIIIVADRVDEPTLISGDPDRMRAVVWPMLNNKFLQQESIGVKLLLPIELRHALFRESSAFFQDARLDKQHLVERLGWTGASLYDLCEARLRACSPPARDATTPPVALLDLFAEDVTKQDLVEALDQMHQPRDAFKFLYRCLVDHCALVTREDNRWRISRHVLETVKRSEAERVQQLHRGIRPG